MVMRKTSVQNRSALLALVLVVSVLSITHCANKPENYNELLGIWITEEKLYEDRFIEFTEDLLVFGTGTGLPNIYFIQKVKKKVGELSEEYTFYCKNFDETAFRFIFYTTESDGSLTLRLNNPRQVVWNKSLK